MTFVGAAALDNRQRRQFVARIASYGEIPLCRFGGVDLRFAPLGIFSRNLKHFFSDRPVSAQPAAIRSMSRVELYEAVWSRPVASIAAELGISAAGLGKLCRRHAVPTPPRGWWTQRDHGKPMERPPLPSLDEIRIRAGSKPKPARSAGRDARSARASRDNRVRPRSPVIDPFVTHTVRRLRSLMPNYLGFVEVREKSTIAVKVGRGSIGRVERILAALSATVEEQGWFLARSGNGVAIAVEGALVAVEIVEGVAPRERKHISLDEIADLIGDRRQQRPGAGGEFGEVLPGRQPAPAWDYVPNGGLRIEFSPATTETSRKRGSSGPAAVFSDNDYVWVEALIADMVGSVAEIARDMRRAAQTR